MRVEARLQVARLRGQDLLAPRDQAWTLGEAGTTPMAEFLAARGEAVTDDEANP